MLLTLPPCDLSSYRPISNLSFLSKLLERVVSVQLTGYLSSAGLLPVHQSAYRRFHSTETALLKVLTDITEAIDAGDHALLGLLDLSAAFDTVDHHVLADRLSRTYGIRSTALDWLRSYLCDCRQTILYDGVLSTVRSLCCGVSQGSVLGPLLFLLYTLPTLGRLLRVSTSHPISTPMTLSFIRGALHRQFHSSGVVWSLVLRGSPNGCVLTDCGSTPRIRTSCGAQPADGVSILTPVS